MNKINPRILIVFGAVVFVYFVIYPEDVRAIFAPIASVMPLLASVLGLSQTVSPWLYMVIAVGIATWGIVRVWGRQEAGRRIT